MKHRFLSGESVRVALRSTSVVRVALFLLLFLSFARVLWRLDANNLWWDESLSLQRAESDWWTLLRGEIVLFDGRNSLPTTDQHPFGFFVLLGTLTRLAGKSEFVLRFPAAMGATLLIPVLWTMGRYAVRRSILPPGTPLIVTLLAALNPFFLYYGQEARMYTLLPLLGLLTIYLLLRWGEASSPAQERRYIIAYAATTFFFLVVHYFSVLLLPIHAILFFRVLYRRNRRAAWTVVGSLLLLGLLFGLAAAWIILSQPLSGRNFQPISLQILVPDLLNAFSLGLSVNIEQVWWLDLIYGAVAILGAVWTLRSWSRIQAGGWLWLGGLLTPILLLLLINQVQPAYMNARHLALISGFYLLLVAAGVALLWRWFRPAGGALLTLLVAGALFSTVNYYTLPEYGKDDFTKLGAYLERELMPGDLVLLNPPEMLRLYRYYLPVDTVEEAQAADLPVAWLGVPLLKGNRQADELIASMLPFYRRVWVVTSGMFPFADPQRQVRNWLESNTLQIRDINFVSPRTYLELDLYLPRYPELDALPVEVRPIDANFGGQIELQGYRVHPPLTNQTVIPVTLYWKAMQPLDTRYKYLLYLETTNGDGETVRLPSTEREPYDGSLPTTEWPPGLLLAEYSDVFVPPEMRDLATSSDLKLVLQIYDADTLTNLPILESAHGEISQEGDRLLFDVLLPAPDLP